MVKRDEIIKQVLDELVQLRAYTVDKNKLYAIDENIFFFRSIKNLGNYLSWFFFRYPKIVPENILEINDLLPKWDKEVIRCLINLEKKKFPGLIKPLVNEIYNFIINSKNREIFLVNIGSGGMEVERQVIQKLLSNNNNFDKKIIFIGIDQSKEAHEVAKENLFSLPIFLNIYQSNEINLDLLEGIKKDNNFISIILINNNIFNLIKSFEEKKLEKPFDIIFHSLFKHHLSYKDGLYLDQIIKKICNIYLEYDGFKKPILFVPHTLEAWRNPIFLNATIFSDIRYFKKDEIKKRYQNIGELKFFKIGTYLLKVININY
jgi:hypothetical protein